MLIITDLDHLNLSLLGVGWCRSILAILVKIGQLNRGFLVDHRENLHPKTPEIDELGQGLFNACLTFKIG